MELGNKISVLRKETGLSQEQLATQLGVSRSAIAKWESEKGLPDIENIIRISELFNKSTDYFLKDNEDIIYIKRQEDTLQKYVGKVCDILLDGWNDGACDALIIGNDEDFVFYQINDKKNERYGAIAKSHITSIKESTKQKDCKFMDISREYFINKQTLGHFLDSSFLCFDVLETRRVAIIANLQKFMKSGKALYGLTAFHEFIYSVLRYYTYKGYYNNTSPKCYISISIGKTIPMVVFH